MAAVGKRKRRRRLGVGRIIQVAIRGLLAACLLIGVLVAVAAGSPAWGLLALPISMIGLIFVVPILLIVLVTVVLALALPAAILTGIFGAPLILLHRLSRHAREQDDEEDEPSVDEDALLRRRYVAGELSYQEFQATMLGRLKDRYARGLLPLPAYEAELEKLLAPARHLDPARDPALAARTL